MTGLERDELEAAVRAVLEESRRRVRENQEENCRTHLRSSRTVCAGPRRSARRPRPSSHDSELADRQRECTRSAGTSGFPRSVSSGSVRLSKPSDVRRPRPRRRPGRPPILARDASRLLGSTAGPLTPDTRKRRLALVDA